MPDQNQTNTPQDPTTVAAPVAPVEPVTPVVPAATPEPTPGGPSIFPQSDLPPLPPEFQTLGQTTPSATPGSDTGSAAPPDLKSILPSKPKKKFGGGRIIATILGLVVLVGGIGAGIVLTQQQQLFNQKAASNRIDCGADSCNADTEVCCNSGCKRKNVGCASNDQPQGQQPGTGGQPQSYNTQCNGKGTRCFYYSCSQKIQCSNNSGALVPGLCNLDDSGAQVSHSNVCGNAADTSTDTSGVNAVVNNTNGSNPSTGNCAAGTVNTYGTSNGTSRTIDVSGFNCTPSSVTFNCTNGQFQTLYRTAACACSAVCGNTETTSGVTNSTGTLGNPGNCSSYTGGPGRCYVTTNIGLGPDGNICNGAHWTTCAAGTVCRNQDCVPGTTSTTTTTTTTTTDVTAPSCVAVKAYDETFTKQLSGAELSALKAGAKINFCVTAATGSSGSYSKAMFKINTTVGAEITTPRTANEYCTSYTIGATDVTISVLAKVFHSASGWVGETF